MNTHQLIGLVAADIIKQSLETREDQDTTVARFLLDRLTQTQVAEICRQILKDPLLQHEVEIKIPRAFADEEELPESILTSERTTYWRNAPCDKPILILANNDDDQGQSLNDLTSLNAKELKSSIDTWIMIASRMLPLTDEQKKQWGKALAGLQQANEYTLEMFADYVAQVHNCIAQEHIPLIEALGYALPVLEIPRDTGYFQAIPEKNRTSVAKWQKHYQDAISKRASLLRKHLPNQQRIDDDDLLKQFNNVKDEIIPEAHEVIQRFLTALDDWTEESAQLAQFEWEKDGISGLFTGLKTKKVDLATETRDFFEDEDPDELTPDDLLYLDALSKRKITREPVDEDKEFYDRHHLTLDKKRPLKAKWDKFVYGKPIECTDFLVGLLDCIERLIAQAGGAQEKRRFIVKTQYEKGKSKWLNALNQDVGLYFCTRYRGFDTLTRPFIDWQTFWLFEYDRLIDEQKNKENSKGEKFTKNVSTARDATQIKFHVSLTYVIHGKQETATTQLIWKCNPATIGMELNDDLNRLSKKPFLLTSVNREPVSKKGHLQEVSLNDVTTLEAAFSQDRGSLVSTSAKALDASKIFLTKLQEAYKDGRIAQDGQAILKQTWDTFATTYTHAIQSFADAEGIASDAILHQADAYCHLLQVLQQYAAGDKNRVDLWHPVLEIGTVRILDGKPAAIIAPWHPLRLLSISVKARQIAHFVQYLIENPNVEFGDDRLFFFHLKNDMSHPYYPEVTIGFQGEQPRLLGLSDTVNDYSLMEIPLRDDIDQTTNENPQEASEKVREVIRRYLELQPHKRSSMGIVLYNCDSKGLPMAVVDKLSSLYDSKAANEVCCQIILRHQDTQKLSELYEKMIDTVENDPDAFIASESENDFMSRLRIGIMATDAETNENSQEKMTDIVFLQDVISRQAQIVWIPVEIDSDVPQPLQHFPARWSRRHPTAYGDLRSIVYLVCPSQPAVGTAYLDAIHDVVGEHPEKGKHFLPSRQVSFQDNKTQRIFQEVHQLGEWVVNYDDLLERRLLQHQNVTVIKYQQNRAQDRNLIISSTSSFQLLQVLVKQRLEKLSLSNEIDIDKLAQTCINEAKNLSGDIVLRAARRGANASELIGLVLSKYLISSELQSGEPVGWFFLDDYASWLGQDEQQIADIMALALCQYNGVPTLKIIISEAKYFEANVADARKTSQKQLKDTVKRIQDALFQNPSRLDRDIWLARLSDLLIDGILVNSHQPIDIQQWRDDLRKGKLQIEVKGYSHVFAPIPDAVISDDPQLKLGGIDGCYQEVFGRKHIQELLLALYRNKPCMPIRASLGDHRPWLEHTPRYPAPDTLWKMQPATNQIPLNGQTPSTSSNGHTLAVPQVASDSGSGEHIAIGNGNHTPNKSQITNQGTMQLHVHKPTLGTNTQSNQGASQTAVIEKNEQWSQAVQQTLQKALISYSLQAKILGSRLTPNALLIRLKGSDHLKVEDLEKKKSVLLTTHGLSLLHITAQPGEIVVSIARPQRETVSLLDVWKEREFFTGPGEMNLCFILGIKEMDGELLYLNVGKSNDKVEQHAPHTLIAGTTGSGKSVLMQNLLLDICQTNSSKLAHIYLIDPKKGVDYQQLLDLPHLREGIITEQGRAQEILSSLVAQMDHRYDLLAKAKVNNLVDYNKKVSLAERLPVLWLVHDEFADWMLVSEYKEAVSASVQRLGTKARAAGIHLIFAAQRPEANILPPQLRDNLGNRLILRVESQGTSEIALGEKGAEKLLGKGHLAAKLGGEITYAQVPFLSSEDQFQVVDEIRKYDNER
ncbi:FtsK/SpoIIIE domain-containing protein [Ktedonobacter racemifer]|uniref:Cell division protein FtsK/SpoIIIE n=1 Tax=Ktedonobacter racemifer DSM 44963 TaxID=485913 RepID=D6TX47_KTERA|nr:FtsK/SpoIIIE domain-containing protein [Ktedonobacter racemifer]EFH84780.1 cell division protein FtsK/SpoIIIE [Ktedonobacter racemifer DSM 44963]